MLKFQVQQAEIADYHKELVLEPFHQLLFLYFNPKHLLEESILLVLKGLMSLLVVNAPLIHVHVVQDLFQDHTHVMFSFFCL